MEQARQLRETAAELCEEVCLTCERARVALDASRDHAAYRRSRPAFNQPLRDEPYHPSMSELEEALGVPWSEAKSVADTFVEALRLAHQGRWVAGYRCLAEPAHRAVAAHNPGIAAEVSLVRLWDKALGAYFALCGVDC